ncbi:MAG: hypothetical protein NVS2B14_13080 [Chamaesiphon sp.]
MDARLDMIRELSNNKGWLERVTEQIKQSVSTQGDGEIIGWYGFAIYQPVNNEYLVSENTGNSFAILCWSKSQQQAKYFINLLEVKDTAQRIANHSYCILEIVEVFETKTKFPSFLVESIEPRAK